MLIRMMTVGAFGVGIMISTQAVAQRKPEAPPPLAPHSAAVPERYAIAQTEVLARLQEPAPPPVQQVIVNHYAAPEPVDARWAARRQAVHVPAAPQVVYVEPAPQVVYVERAPRVVYVQPAPVVVYREVWAPARRHVSYSYSSFDCSPRRSGLSVSVSVGGGHSHGSYHYSSRSWHGRSSSPPPRSECRPVRGRCR